jgi:uncharacterized protein YjbI with pentapeptide repeats
MTKKSSTKMTSQDILSAYIGGQRRFTNIKADAVDLTGAYLSGASFLGASLQRANFSRASLTHIQFKIADLTR